MAGQVSYTEHWPLSKIPNPAPVPASFEHQIFQVQNDGIYRALPVYDGSHHGKTAIVAGANGISGTHMLRAMARHPNIWSRVYALSRRSPQMTLPDGFSKNVSHHSINLLTTPSEVGEEFRNAGITGCDYALFYAYVQTEPKDPTLLWAEADTLAELNGKLFYNFLEGMKEAGIRPKRILLQTGGKGYSSHLGPVVSPIWEDDKPRARHYYEPNFYYCQEDLLWDYCQRNGVDWVYSRPAVIMGVVKDNALNLMIPLALYAAVTKHLGQKVLKFPGTRTAFEQTMNVASAFHNGIMMEWQLLAPQAANQIFHTNDGTAFSWLRFWEWLSNIFGLEWEAPLAEDDPEANYKSYVTTDTTPPIGYGTGASCKYSFTLVDWSQTQEVRQAYAEMVAKFGLDPSYIDMKYSWAMANWAACRWWTDDMSLAKARKYGYFGVVDWTDSLKVVLDEAVDMKIIPPLES